MEKTVETKKEAVKAEAPAAKAEPAKKTATRKTATRKTAAAVKKAPAARKAAAPRAAKKSEEIIVQFNGADWSVADIKAKVAAAAGKGAKNVEIYVNVVEGKAYYVVDGKDGGSVEL